MRTDHPTAEGSTFSNQHFVTPLAYDKFRASGEGYQAMIDASAAQCTGTSDEIAEAAASLEVADTGKGELWVEDAAVAAGYILLEAEQLGIGACWNQIRGRDGQQLSASDEIKQTLGIPSRYEVLCVIALGHPAESKQPHTERVINLQGRTHFGKF